MLKNVYEGLNVKNVYEGLNVKNGPRLAAAWTLTEDFSSAKMILQHICWRRKNSTMKCHILKNDLKKKGQVILFVCLKGSILLDCFRCYYCPLKSKINQITFQTNLEKNYFRHISWVITNWSMICRKKGKVILFKWFLNKCV